MRNALAVLLLTTAAASAQTVTTNTTGGSQPFENRQPGLALHFVVQTTGAFGIGVPVRIFAYPNSTMAALASSSGSGNWVPADGRILPIGANSALFSQLGVTYGGNGATNFAIPDLRGRVIVGEGTQNGVTYSRGQVLGSATTVLNTTNLPPHIHTEPDSLNGYTNPAGNGAPFDSMQPSLVLRGSMIINGLYPCRGCGPLDDFAVPPTDGYFSEVLFHAATPSSSYDNYYAPTDGSIRTIQSNTALFSLIGVTYGGNGVQTYAYPDLRGRLSTFYGQGPGLTNLSWGEVIGSTTVSLYSANMPSHNHTVNPATGVSTPTGFSGSSPPLRFSTQQPTVTLSYFIAVNGVYPNSNTMYNDLGYNGEIIAMANNFTPPGYLPCDGSLVSIATYDTLYNLIGTTYGGDGINTFALPDLRGRVPIGASLSPGGLAAGTVVGAETVTLGTAQMPAHTHTFTPPCPGDIGIQGGIAGHDGLRDNNDFIVYINDFFNHSPSSDVGQQGGVGGPDGQWDNNDFIVYINRFFSPC